MKSIKSIGMLLLFVVVALFSINQFIDQKWVPGENDISSFEEHEILILKTLHRTEEGKEVVATTYHGDPTSQIISFYLTDSTQNRFTLLQGAIPKKGKGIFVSVDMLKEELPSCTDYDIVELAAKITLTIVEKDLGRTCRAIKKGDLFYVHSDLVINGRSDTLVYQIKKGKSGIIRTSLIPLQEKLSKFLNK